MLLRKHRKCQDIFTERFTTWVHTFISSVHTHHECIFWYTHHLASSNLLIISNNEISWFVHTFDRMWNILRCNTHVLEHRLAIHAHSDRCDEVLSYPCSHIRWCRHVIYRCPGTDTPVGISRSFKYPLVE